MKGALYLSTIALLLLNSCNNNSSNQENHPINDSSSVSTTNQEVTAPAPPRPVHSYHAIPMKGNDTAYKYITNTFTGDSLNIILQLNRVDKKHLRNVDSVVIPDNFTTDLMSYTPFPTSLPFMKDVNKFVVFSYPIQAYGVYEKGNLIKWGGTSMGKKATKTPTGLHYTNWKGRKITSTVNKSWILEYNFNIMNKFGVGWHLYDMPGYPASHSCLRLFLADAQWLYDYCDQWILEKGQLVAKGNPVLVYGDYPWGELRPWYHLVEDGQANNVDISTIEELIAPELENILKEQNNRQTIMNQNSRDSITSI